MEPVDVNGSVHTTCKQHQSIWVRTSVRASSVDWAWNKNKNNEQTNNKNKKKTVSFCWSLETVLLVGSQPWESRVPESRRQRQQLHPQSRRRPHRQEVRWAAQPHGNPGTSLRFRPVNVSWLLWLSQWHLKSWSQVSFLGTIVSSNRPCCQWQEEKSTRRGRRWCRWPKHNGVFWVVLFWCQRGVHCGHSWSFLLQARLQLVRDCTTRVNAAAVFVRELEALTKEEYTTWYQVRDRICNCALNPFLQLRWFLALPFMISTKCSAEPKCSRGWTPKHTRHNNKRKQN